LAPLTWFQVGGSAATFLKAETTEELVYFLKNHQDDDYFVLGAGSNVLISDEGLTCPVIKLHLHHFNIVRNSIIVEAGMLDRTLSMEMAHLGFGGFEFLSTIPGTIGGGIFMNAGAYGHEICDHLQWIEYVNQYGDVQRLRKDQIKFSYRSSHLPHGLVITKAAFEKHPVPPNLIFDKINEYQKKREESQPVRVKTGGSTFKNPLNYKAWELIDQAGCRGMVYGGAQISSKHCNFLINTDNATALDLKTLGNIVQEKVFKTTGILLEWEIICM
jgi:UDP-N-acetylmuramate dehydrogenase